MKTRHEADGNYRAPRHGWTCFHCGETFRSTRRAMIHFGATPDRKPGCLLKVEPGLDHALLSELRQSEHDRGELEVRLRAARLGLDSKLEEEAVARYRATHYPRLPDRQVLLDAIKRNKAADVERGRELIAACEKDLGRKLSDGECRDLLMDNTAWPREAIVAVVDRLTMGHYP